VSSRADAMEFTFPSGKIRCVLAHDHVLLRQGLRRLLEDQPDIDVVGEAGNAAECLRKVYEFRPDVVVVDACTLGLPALEAERSFSRESPNTKIVFLSTESNDSFATSGAAEGCNVRKTSAEELADMVRNSCGGSKMKISEISGSAKPPRADAVPVPAGRTLTVREREVLKLLAEGKTVRTTATVLGLSSKTVDSHKFNLMRKLGIHNKAELVMWAIQKRVLKMPVNF
jgi:two-component system, NarL family, response regulator NreC